jgi:hypothetical protein
MVTMRSSIPLKLVALTCTTARVRGEDGLGKGGSAFGNGTGSESSFQVTT